MASDLEQAVARAERAEREAEQLSLTVATLRAQIAAMESAAPTEYKYDCGPVLLTFTGESAEKVMRYMREAAE